MAEYQNVTLSLPRELLRRIKRLAADRDTSISSLMTEALTRLGEWNLGGTRRRVAAPSLRCGPLDRSARVDAAHGRATRSMSAEVAQEFVGNSSLQSRPDRIQ